MGDWGDALSGAGSGALAGFGAGGPLGAAIGGGVGLLSGIFSQKAPEQQTYQDPNQGQIDSSINSLMTSHAGAQLAQNEAQGFRRDARSAFDTMQQNPGVSGNASVMSALYNKTQGTAADAITNANARGAQADQNTRAQGIQMAQANSRNRFSMAQYNNMITQANNRPGFFQNILMSSIGSLAGKGVGALGAGKTDDDVTTGLGSGSTGNGLSTPGSILNPGIPSSLSGAGLPGTTGLYGQGNQGQDSRQPPPPWL